MPAPWPRCALAGWKHACGPSTHGHHIVNKSKLPNDYAIRKFVEKTHRELFIVDVCDTANVGRLADSKEAQARLLRRQLRLFTAEYVRSVWGELDSLYRERLGVPLPHDLTIEGILAKR